MLDANHPPFEKRIQLLCHDAFQGDLAKFIVCINGIHMHVYTIFAIKVFYMCFVKGCTSCYATAILD